MNITIHSEEGFLQAAYNKSEENNSKIAIVLADHPKEGSTMNSKAVYTLFHVLALKGYNVIRFNYRGVDKSKGVFTNGENEISDAANVLDWIEKNNENFETVAVVGIGFGAWVGSHLIMRRPEINRFILVQPSLNYEYNFINPYNSIGLLINNNDLKESLQAKEEKLITKLRKVNSEKVVSFKIPKAPKSFEGHLKPLFNVVNEFLIDTE